MAEPSVLATISGAALSLLFYENACSVGDQMGFLLGDVVTFVSQKVTDSERHVESMRQHIEITGVLACSSAGQLFHETGKLHTEKLINFVQDRRKEIVGWFRFRQNNPPVPTFRDKILHKELANFFHGNNGRLPKECFVACILSAMTGDNMGTHRFRHVFIRYEDGIYRPVPLRINNLGGNVTRHDGSDYIPTPAARISQEPDVFTKFVKSLNLDGRHRAGRDLVTTIEKAAEHHVESLIPQLCQSDREIYEMEKELQELRLKIVSKVMSMKTLSSDNQRVHELNNRERIRMEGDSSIPIEMRDEETPKTANVYSDRYINKESAISKPMGSLRPNSNTNTMRSSSDSTQRSPGTRCTYSNATRKSIDSEDMSDY